MHGYEVVYDVSQAGFADWPFLLVAGCMLAFGIGFSLWLRARHPEAPHWVGYLFGVVGFTCGAAGALVGYVQQQSLIRALDEGGAQVVEGPIEAVVPLGTNEEGSFVVGGERFTYSRYERELGVEDQLVESGVRARVHHAGGTILRLELVRQHQDPGED